MGWHSSRLDAVKPFEHQQQRVRQVLQAYRDKYISTCFLYPTFRSSSVIMTLSAPRSLPNHSLRTSGFLTKPQSPPRPPKRPRGFLGFWWNDQTREHFLHHVPTEDLASLRLACHDFSVRAAPVLFAEITITFRAGSFTRPSRMAALERIGHHVRTLTVHIPHSSETFLPPILDPVTGEEKSFVYVPQASTPTTLASRIANPKYGSWEMTELLIQQYGPMFHAATNVPAFVRALHAMCSVEHLKISCPGQEPSQRYRRSVVDYALISLRIAVERAPLKRLSTLSLLPIHPGGILYLRSNLAFGGSPKSCRRWAQVKRLAIHMDCWKFDSPGVGTDQLKLLHDYLSQLSPNLERVSFRWRGAQGPCPFTLHSETALASPADRKRQLRRLHFPRLKYMELANAYPDASQVCGFIDQHRRTMRECDFEEIDLRSGNWDDAFAVLTRLSGSDRWKQEQVVESILTVDPSRRGSLDKIVGESWFGSPRHMDEFLRNSTVMVR